MSKFQVIFRVENLDRTDIDTYLNNSKNLKSNYYLSKNIRPKDIPISNKLYDLLSTPLMLRISSSIDEFPTVSDDSDLNEIEEKIYKRYFHSAIDHKKSDGIVYKKYDNKKTDRREEGNTN